MPPVSDEAAWPIPQASAGQPDSSRPHALVGLLAFATGSVDAISLLALGGAFTSVITGNLVFIGRAIGTSTLAPAEHALLAVAGYICGVALGSRVGHLLDRAAEATAWPRRASIVLGIELAFLAVLNAAWIAYCADPPAQARDAMLLAAAIALGMQGAAARLISPAPSTTYMTGALTVLIEAVMTGRHRNVDISAIAGLLATVAGASVGALLVEQAPRAALLPAFLAVTCVVAVKARDHRLERAGASTVRVVPKGPRTHHLGVTVDDLDARVAACVTAGFRLDSLMDLTDGTAAIGNGLDALSLQTAWLSYGETTLELIECTPPGSTRRSFPDDVGTGAITMAARTNHEQRQERLDVDGCPITFQDDAEPGITRVELRVASPQDTARLFARIGFRRDDSTTHAATVRSNDLVVDIEPARCPRGVAAPNESGRFQISQVVDDVEEMCRGLRADGWETVSEPQRHASGVRWVFVRDPGGSALELIQVDQA